MQLEAQMQFSGAALANIAFGHFNRLLPARRLALVYLRLSTSISAELNDSIMQVVGERNVAWYVWLSMATAPAKVQTCTPFTSPYHFPLQSAFVDIVSLVISEVHHDCS
jgi:hypothetical protein